MLRYNVWLAWKSVRRTSKLSALIILGIALGVGISTAAIGLFRFFSGDPIPHKSDVLYSVRIDSWDPQARAPHTGGIPTQLTYRDTQAMLASDIPSHRAAMFKSDLYIFPQEAGQRPFLETVRVTSSDFFTLFDVPFAFGGPWDRQADDQAEAVAVIDQELNDRLFGGSDSVGKTFRIAQQEFRVIGVIGTWKPKVKYYDMTQSPFQPLEHVFIPFSHLEPMELRTSGNSDGWQRNSTEGTFGDQLQVSETCFIQMWVQLDDPEALASFQSFVDAYTNEQAEVRTSPTSQRQSFDHRRGFDGGMGGRARTGVCHGGVGDPLFSGVLSQPDRPLSGQVSGSRTRCGNPSSLGGEPTVHLYPTHRGERAHRLAGGNPRSWLGRVCNSAGWNLNCSAKWASMVSSISTAKSSSLRWCCR